MPEPENRILLDANCAGNPISPFFVLRTSSADHVHMRRAPGERATRIVLPTIGGCTFDSATLEGKRYLLSFYRFASCPFCNLRLHQLVRRSGELGPDFTMVAVFDSPVDNLRRYTQRHEAPFPILADEDNRYYREYAVEHSFRGVLKGIVRRLPTLARATLKGYLPTRIKGSLTTMPADFLIDGEGIIRAAHYGEDEGDHIAFDEILAFSRDQ